MTKFNSPLFVGFDRLLEELERANAQDKSYPPHNIIKVDDSCFLIELAVAGYKEKDINIEFHKGKLTVVGNIEDAVEGTYLYKGISSKKFAKTFNLNDNINVLTAALNDGILTIGLELVIPDEEKPKQIRIA